MTPTKQVIYLQINFWPSCALTLANSGSLLSSNNLAKNNFESYLLRSLAKTLQNFNFNVLVYVPSITTTRPYILSLTTFKEARNIYRVKIQNAVRNQDPEFNLNDVKNLITDTVPLTDFNNQYPDNDYAPRMILTNNSVASVSEWFSFIPGHSILNRNYNPPQSSSVMFFAASAGAQRTIVLYGQNYNWYSPYSFDNTKLWPQRNSIINYLDVHGVFDYTQPSNNPFDPNPLVAVKLAAYALHQLLGLSSPITMDTRYQPNALLQMLNAESILIKKRLFSDINGTNPNYLARNLRLRLPVTWQSNVAYLTTLNTISFIPNFLPSDLQDLVAMLNTTEGFDSVEYPDENTISYENNTTTIPA